MAKIGDLFETQSELTIELKIKDFYSLSDKEDIHYDSVRFYFSGSSWEIMIYPNGESENNSEDWIGVYLMRRSFGSPIALNFTLALKTVDGKKESNVNYKYTFHKKDSGYGCPKLISRTVLLQKKAELIPSDILTVICTLRNGERNPVTGSLFSRLQDVSDNLKDIYKQAKRSDLLLKIDGETIRSHRLILETRSPVFAAMLNHDTKENQTGEVSISNLDKNTMETLLVHMYSGDIDTLTTESVLAVYDAAEKYDIKDVKEMCIKFIILNLSVEWVCDVIKFAELYQEEELSRRAREFFKENASKILECENWKTFAKENHDIGVDLLASIVKSLLSK